MILFHAMEFITSRWKNSHKKIFSQKNFICKKISINIGEFSDASRNHNHNFFFNLRLISDETSMFSQIVHNKRSNI